MDSTFLTPASRRLLTQLQLFFALTGIILLAVGGIRIAIEFFDLLRTTANEFNPEIISTPTLALGIFFAAVGYISLYSMAAVGAKEPPALGATRLSLIALAIALCASTIWTATFDLRYFAGMLIASILVLALIVYFWLQIIQQNLWQIFGERLDRGRGNFFILYIVAGAGLILMIALGIIYAIFTDMIELPLDKPAPGELLYTTTFDNFNDEWDLPRGRESAFIEENQLIVSNGLGISDTAFFSLLKHRKFGDFDLRVTVRHISGTTDNRVGVVFRHQDISNHYLFEITEDGFYRLTRVYEGRAESITPKFWTPGESFIHIDGTPNEIRVIAKGNEFTFFVNGQQVPLCMSDGKNEPTINPLNGKCISSEMQMSYQDDTFTQGNIAMSVGSTYTSDLSEPIVIGFDNIVIVGPQE